MRCPPSPHPPSSSHATCKRQVGLQTMPGPVKYVATALRRSWHAMSSVLGAAPTLSAPPGSSHAVQPTAGPGQKQCRALGGCRSAAHRPSRDPVSVSVHVPPAQVGTPCPRGPVTRGRLTANHTERGRLCTSTKTEPQNKQHTTNQQPHCPTTPEAWSVTATMRTRVPRDTAQRRDNLLFRHPVPL